MVKEKFVFEYNNDLTMKAVADLISQSSKYRSTVYIVKGGRRANAKSLLGVMSMGIGDGSEIEIEASGDDERQCVTELISYLKSFNG